MELSRQNAVAAFSLGVWVECAYVGKQDLPWPVRGEVRNGWLPAPWQLILNTVVTQEIGFSAKLSCNRET